jgi:hypothetical protein
MLIHHEPQPRQPQRPGRVRLQQLHGVVVGGLLALGGLASAHVLLPPPATTQRGQQREDRPARRDQREFRQPFRIRQGLAFGEQHKHRDSEREEHPREQHRHFGDEGARVQRERWDRGEPQRA